MTKDRQRPKFTNFWVKSQMRIAEPPMGGLRCVYVSFTMLLDHLHWETRRSLTKFKSFVPDDCVTHNMHCSWSEDH